MITLALILVCIILAPMALRALAELSLWAVLFICAVTLALWWLGPGLQLDVVAGLSLSS